MRYNVANELFPADEIEDGRQSKKLHQAPLQETQTVSTIRLSCIMISNLQCTVHSDQYFISHMAAILFLQITIWMGCWSPSLYPWPLRGLRPSLCTFQQPKEHHWPSPKFANSSTGHSQFASVWLGVRIQHGRCRATNTIVILIYLSCGVDLYDCLGDYYGLQSLCLLLAFSSGTIQLCILLMEPPSRVGFGRMFQQGGQTSTKESTSESSAIEPIKEDWREVGRNVVDYLANQCRSSLGRPLAYGISGSAIWTLLLNR